MKHEFSFSYERFQQATELIEEDRYLLEKAYSATAQAYAPYSNFQVGCAVFLEDGTIVLGNNQENAAYPSGLCAERTAFFYIGANFSHLKIRKMAIRVHAENFQVDEPLSPCGACRQVLLEYQQRQPDYPIAVLLQGEKGDILRLESIYHLLPFGFFEKQLQKR